MAEAMPSVVVGASIQQLKQLERSMQLATNIVTAVYRNADAVPREVLDAVDDWYGYISEVAE